MAQHINIVLVDDIDGSEATETVAFALDGTAYEIDLTDEHAQTLRDAVATYIDKGRRVTRRAKRAAASNGAAAAGGGPSAREIREWARDNEHSVPDRGRVPAEVRAAYAAAH